MTVTDTMGFVSDIQKAAWILADAFDSVLGQPKVRDFLRQSIRSGRTSHAYLFCGPTGSNKTSTAFALAQVLLCPNNPHEEKGGLCGKCENCNRIRRKSHPDVKFLEPAGANGYLVEQIREVVSDCSFAPIQADKKIFIMDRVDLLNHASANAFLKTLEEPPDNVVFILLGRTRDSVLETIASRCQVIPFRHIPPTEAAGIVAQNTGSTVDVALEAIEACSGSITKAIEFLRGGNDRIAFRSWLLQSLRGIWSMSDWDVLQLSKQVMEKTKTPITDIQKEMEKSIVSNSEFLAKSAIRQIEAKNKRQLSKKTSDYLKQALAITSSWLRDAIVVSSGTPELVVNVDRVDDLEMAAGRLSEVKAYQALVSIGEAAEMLDYNVNPEICFNVALFKVREVFNGACSTY